MTVFENWCPISSSIKTQPSPQSGVPIKVTCTLIFMRLTRLTCAGRISQKNMIAIPTFFLATYTIINDNLTAQTFHWSRRHKLSMAYAPDLLSTRQWCNIHPVLWNWGCGLWDPPPTEMIRAFFMNMWLKYNIKINTAWLWWCYN